MSTTTTIPKPICHTTLPGESCYRDVDFALSRGIFEHPGWYPGLNPRSTLEDFQGILAENPKLKCPRPCPCRTAQPGSACHDSIKWVLREGLAKNPAWYVGLNFYSRFEAVQARLHEDKGSTCDRPCTPRRWGNPSLFCWAIFRSTGYELELVRSQAARAVGIFECDEFASLSDAALDLGRGISTILIPPCEHVGTSKDGTAANTLIFMTAWWTLYHDVRWRSHNWIIKADPDAVLLPNRLRDHLRPHTGRAVFVKNCGKWPGPGWPMMFGSLEAFSREAMEIYYNGAETCKRDLQWQAWGEDLFMGSCMERLGVVGVADTTIIGDNVCTGANCFDGVAAAYHPFKSAAAWFRCRSQALSR